MYFHTRINQDPLQDSLKENHSSLPTKVLIHHLEIILMQTLLFHVPKMVKSLGHDIGHHEKVVNMFQQMAQYIKQMNVVILEISRLKL